MNYTLMPSLEHRALVKIAIALWNQIYIRVSTSYFHFIFILVNGTPKEWQSVEDIVIEKVQELPLPESLKKKLSGIIKPIGFEILQWRDYHEKSIGLINRYVKKNLHNLCWTPEGTVDRKKTAEAFIRDENLDITIRYKLACTYCFQNDILTLLNKMPEWDRRCYYNKEDVDRVKRFQKRLVVFWSYYINGEVTRINNGIERNWQRCSPYQYAFELAVGDGNKVATEYFFQKLTSEEREESLMRSAELICFRIKCTNYAPVPDYEGVLCFLLSQMNEEQLVEVFEGDPYPVLKCFLYWPYQGFFMETAKRISAFLSEMHFELLIRLIVHQINDGHQEYNYHELLREFWQQSPTTTKKKIIENFLIGYLLKHQYEAKYKSIKVILKSASSFDKEKIIFSHIGKHFCSRLLYDDEMDFLEFFVQECLSCSDIMRKFRKEFKRTVICSLLKKELEKEKVMYNKFYRFINNLIRKNNKRALEEGISGSAKRVCSLKNK